MPESTTRANDDDDNVGTASRTPLVKTHPDPVESPSPTGFHPIRRAMTTVDEASAAAGAHIRRRPGHLPHGIEFGSPRRRSSTFSDYSLNEARRSMQGDIFNPGATSGVDRHQASNLSSLPLAFALLPAVGGLFFQNGSAVVTDAMLLGLAAVFLHWSVTQPWSWYHVAQQVRIRDERLAEMAMEDDSDDEPCAGPGAPSEAEDGQGEATPGRNTETATPCANRTSQAKVHKAQKALTELYIHEITALVWCFLFPVLGAYLLHAIRNQLSRPSEGLVSNYNLSIFLLAAEIHPLSHLIKLVQARTLHLQRIVNANPFKDESPTNSLQIQALLDRIERLETTQAAPEVGAQNSNLPDRNTKQEVTMVRDVRNAIQPELDALNRAVRRYEKKATVLALQTESRLGALDSRLNDAIALAAAAAKTSASQWSVFGWLMDRAWSALLLPFHALLGLATLPFRALSATWKRSRPAYERGSRDRKGGKGSSSSRMSSSDRVSSRVSRR